MKKMLDTIVKSKNMGDDIFIELGNSADVGLLPGIDEDIEIIDINSGVHKDKKTKVIKAFNVSIIFQQEKGLSSFKDSPYPND